MIEQHLKIFFKSFFLISGNFFVSGNKAFLLNYLSSRTGMSWSPLSGLKGVKPPLVFGGRTRDCSPGNAGNEGPSLPTTGASRRFSRAVALVWGFSRSKTGQSRKQFHISHLYVFEKLPILYPFLLMWSFFIDL